MEWVLLVIALVVLILLLYQFFGGKILPQTRTACKQQLKGYCVETKEECTSEEGKIYNGMGCEKYCCIPLENVGLN